MIVRARWFEALFVVLLGQTVVRCRRCGRRSRTSLAREARAQSPWRRRGHRRHSRPRSTALGPAEDRLPDLDAIDRAIDEVAESGEPDR